MALCSKDASVEKAATLERAATLEKAVAVAPTAAERRTCCSLGRVLTLLTLAACCLCLGFVELHRLRQGAELQRQLLQLQLRLDQLEGSAPPDPQLDATPVGDPTLFRSRRSVDDGALRTIDGVPIVPGPYGSRRRPPSQGLRIYETFLTDREAQPTAASVTYETDDPSIQPHHRSSAVFRTVGRFGRVNTNTVIAADERPPVGAASAPTGRRVVPGELHRRSRVSQEDFGGAARGRAGAAAGRSRASELTRAAGSRRVSGVGGRQAAPVLEARGSPPAFVSPPSVGGGRSGHRSRVGSPQPHCAAAHYEGHVGPLNRKTSSYGGSEGNGRLRNTNPDAMFSDWRPASWMEQQRCEDDFRLYGGQVTVAQPGLYYLYAQINYLEDSDINGFDIQVNARSLVKCITMEASDLEEKTNTCHTGAVTYLGPGDAVSIRDLEPNRHSILLPDRSFFGLLRLSSSG